MVTLTHNKHKNFINSDCTLVVVVVGGGLELVVVVVVLEFTLDWCRTGRRSAIGFLSLALLGRIWLHIYHGLQCGEFYILLL